MSEEWQEICIFAVSFTKAISFTIILNDSVDFGESRTFVARVVWNEKSTVSEIMKIFLVLLSR